MLRNPPRLFNNRDWLVAALIHGWDLPDLYSRLWMITRDIPKVRGL